MFKNYFTIAFRHLTRHKFFSFINILCLAIGITFSLVIGVYVLDQYGVNASLKHANNQYIIKSDWKVKEMGLELTTFGPLAKAARREYPSLVANYYRYNPVTNVVSAGDKFFKEDIAIGDTSFISMFGFKLLYGNPLRAFIDNKSAVITATMAKRLFGDENAINKIISVQTLQNAVKQDYKVSAVLADLPNNSITNYIGDRYNVFVPTEGNNYYGSGDPAEGWSGAYEVAMIELRPGVSPKQLVAPFKKLLAKYTPEVAQKNLTVRLAPVRDYYLKDHNGAMKKMIMILSIAAIFILTMAIINFVNINIGTSSYRLKEIGLRKVFGGEKIQLVVQFIAEAILLTTLSAIISLFAYQLLRPLSSRLLNIEFPSVFSFGGNVVTFLLCLVAITGFIAGIYPAFVLSSLRIVNAVKGKFSTAKSGFVIRRAMLTLQFTLAIIVFISALIVSRQLNYVFTKDVGYNKDQVLVITAFPKRWDSVGTTNMEGIRNELAQLRYVKDASISFEIPDRKPPGSIDMQAVNGDGKTVLITSAGADEHYASTFGLKMLSGSCFAQDGGYLANQIVLSESAAKALGFTNQSAINKQVKVPSSGTLLTVSGVFKDYNYSSLQEQVEPLALFNVKDARSYRYLSLKLNSSDMLSTVNDLQEQWKKASPGTPFEFNFMDDKFQALYKTELQLKSATSIATVLNLIIVFLGIFGVVTFTLAKRTKEIAMRKVLGASLTSIVNLFTRDYAWLLLLSNVIAWPIAYVATNSWLHSYAYRVSQSAMPYLFVAISIFIIAFAMIAIQCIKASSASPIRSLRTE